MLVDQAATLEGIFRHSPTIILTDCEDTPRIKAAEAAAKAKWGEDVPAAEHPRLRDVEACYLSSSMAAELARRHDARPAHPAHHHGQGLRSSARRPSRASA
jgi:dihydroorotase